MKPTLHLYSHSIDIEFENLVWNSKLNLNREAFSDSQVGRLKPRLQCQITSYWLDESEQNQTYIILPCLKKCQHNQMRHFDNERSHNNQGRMHKPIGVSIHKRKKNDFIKFFWVKISFNAECTSRSMLIYKRKKSNFIKKNTSKINCLYLFWIWHVFLLITCTLRVIKLLHRNFVTLPCVWEQLFIKIGVICVLVACLHLIR